MHCTTEPGSRFSRPRKCNCCCRLSPPKPEAWEHGPSDANLRVSTRWRWNGRRMPAYRERCQRRRRRGCAAGRKCVGDAHAAGIGAEVVIVHQNRRAIPFGSGVLEVADQFPFLAIDADDRKTLSLEASLQRADMLELLIAVGTGVGGDLLAVDTQREVHLVQETSDRIGRDRNADLLKNLGDLLGRLAGPLQPRDGVSGRVVLQKNLDRLDYFGRFFSTGLRPPPALRARSTSTS